MQKAEGKIFGKTCIKLLLLRLFGNPRWIFGIMKDGTSTTGPQRGKSSRIILLQLDTTVKYMEVLTEKTAGSNCDAT